MRSAGRQHAGPRVYPSRRRTYDISITYDKYYRTPHVYLFGYDEVPPRGSAILTTGCAPGSAASHAGADSRGRELRARQQGTAAIMAVGVPLVVTTRVLGRRSPWRITRMARCRTRPSTRARCACRVRLAHASASRRWPRAVRACARCCCPGTARACCRVVAIVLAVVGVEGGSLCCCP